MSENGTQFAEIVNPKVSIRQRDTIRWGWIRLHGLRFSGFHVIDSSTVVASLTI